MVKIASGVGLEALLIRRVTVHRTFDIGAAQGHVTVVDAAGPAEIGGGRQTGRGGDDASVFNHLPAPAGVQIEIGELIFQLHAALTKLGETFGIALFITGPVIIEHAARVKIVAGTQLDGTVISCIETDDIGEIT